MTATPNPEDKYFMTSYKADCPTGFWFYPKFASDKLKWSSETKEIRFRSAGLEVDADQPTDVQIINFYNTLSPSERAYVGL